MARHCARIPWPRYDRNSRLGLLPGALLALMLSNCGVPPEQELATELELKSGSSPLKDFTPPLGGTGRQAVGDNGGGSTGAGNNGGGSSGRGNGGGNHGAGNSGLGTNGLGTNGLGTNGLGTNGLATSGLSISAMYSNDFLTWFNQDPALSDMVMRYIVMCAVAEGSSRIWTNPVTSVQYTWHGSLGLTPAWASGSSATEVEQQVITACLAAHTNKYGLQVPFSVQGLDATGTPIPVGELEFGTYSAKEACFFGNLFQGEGIFAGNDAVLTETNSSVRACGLKSNASQVDECPPIRHVNPCQEICTPDALNNYYSTCTYNGKSYRALTTRIRPADIFVCGDGVCQVSESCGTGLTPGSCRDCGPCL